LLVNIKSVQIKYIGAIIFGITALFVIWLYDQGPQAFFEEWSCINIVKLTLNFNVHERLTEFEDLRLHEILDGCFDKEEFMRFEH